MPGTGPRSSHRIQTLLLTAAASLLASAALVAPAGASAAQASPLSPRLVVLSSPGVRALGAARQAKRVGLAPHGAGSLLRHGRRLVVAVRFDEGALARTEDLKAAGAQVIDGSRRYQTDTVAVLPGQLRKLAAVPGVEGVQEEITPITRAAASCPQGSVVTEGDSQLEANRARELFNVDGSGVTVGVLSDSFNQWYAGRSEAEDVASGDLPGPTNPCGFERAVKVVTPFIPGAYPEPGEEPENPPSEEEETGEGSDEGRGMAQIVHDIAPGANIDFASAFNGSLAFAKAIRDLKAEGAQVIGDDVSYFDEPFFQDGPIADAVNEVTAQGVNYFSAAGNDNLQNEEGENIGSFETPEYEGIECPVAIPSFYESCENFSPEAAEGEEDDTFGITLEKEWPLFLDLQWGQPWNGVTTDFDMFLIREGGEVVPAFNEPNTEPGRQEPYEMIPWEAHEEEGEPEEEVQVVIARCDEACGEARAEEETEPGVKPWEGTKGGDEGTPRLKLAIVNNGGGVPEIEYPPAAYEKAESEDVVGPTIYGHTAAASAISVAAIDVRTKEKPEYYSSRGPVLHLFGPVTGTGAAAPIGEQTIAKPNLTASDCGATTAFFEPAIEGKYYFCGTSAATPHAAGVAALLRSANPGATNAQVRAAMEGTAVPIGPLGARYPATAVGAGLVDAKAAVAALALPPTVTITNPPAALGNVRRPAIGFAANRPASFVCSLDGAAATACSSPYVPAAALADGKHTFTVTATDAAGRTGSATAAFTVDTKAPKLKFAKHPKAVVKTRKGSVKETFRLSSNEKGVTFQCKVDKGKFKPCKAKFSKAFKVGRHTVWAKATDGAGNVSKTVTSKFRVERIKKHKKGH
jgi:subtilisin family serine protease